MAYWRLLYHFVWTTKERMPLIEADIEPHLYRFLHAEANKMYCPFFYVNGISEHVHVVTAIRPSVSPAEFVKQLKGATSRFVSLEFKRPFEWQEGYGAFSLSDENLNRAIEYVQGQKQHHFGPGTLIDEWERTDDRNAGPEKKTAGGEGLPTQNAPG